MGPFGKKIILFSMVLLVFLPDVSESKMYLEKGYIQNDKGEKCWYKQKTDSNNTYFHGINNTVGIITFDNPKCMSDSGIGLDVNKMMINNVISRWYSHSDANFQTRVSEMFNSSPLQKKGKCIQSKKYPNIGITVDYFIKNKSIKEVIHGMAVSGCKD